MNDHEKVLRDALLDARTIYDIACIRERAANATREDVEFKAMALRNYNALAAIGERGEPWRPIGSAPKDEVCLFWVVPKTADETYRDTSGNPILAKSKPSMRECKYGEWGSLMKATHWHPRLALPTPPTQGAQPNEETP